MSILSLHSIIIDTVIFDFDGTLAKLNIDFDHMRRDIDHLISLYGVDHQRLQNAYVLEIIEPVFCPVILMRRTLSKQARM